ncbi:MAG: SUMF1/EgtB/PvdO family nonheme iron enzyme [Cyanobacteriota bacterium]
MKQNKSILKSIYLLIPFLVINFSCTSETKDVKTSNSKAPIENKVAIESKPKIVDDSSLKMIKIEGGSFDMGNNTGENDEKPVHKITLNSFYIAKYETTQKEYQSIMGNNPSNFKKDNDVSNNFPVEKVSWFDAIKYCNEKSRQESLPQAYNDVTGDLLDKDGKITTDLTKVIGYRLPTEAEWEFSAKGGTKSQAYIYSGSNTVDEVGWLLTNSEKKTHEVGMKKSNELGIYDMSGNVWEWCNDWYDENFYKTSTEKNPINLKASDTRVSRGGSLVYDANYLRSSNRYGDIPVITGSNLGFRIAKSF